MAFVIREGDSAVGHTDIQGNAVTGTVQAASCSPTVKNGGKRVATSQTIVSFPSHPHALDEGSPIDYRSHAVAISASGKHKANGSKLARHGDAVGVADEAGPDASLIASTSNLASA